METQNLELRSAVGRDSHSDSELMVGMVYKRCSHINKYYVNVKHKAAVSQHDKYKDFNAITNIYEAQMMYAPPRCPVPTVADHSEFISNV